jgi:hypothetical protein
MADFDTDEKCEAWIKEHGIDLFRRNATGPLGFGGTRRLEAQAYLARLDASAATEDRERQDAVAVGQLKLARSGVFWAIIGAVIGAAALGVAKGWL